MKVSNIKWAFGVVLFSMLTSCLKNNEYYTDFKAGGASVQLPLAARNRNKLVTFAFDASAGTVNIPVYVNVASPEKPTSPVTIKLGLDTAALNQYNTDNDAAFDVLPDSVYTTNGFDRTVQAGQRMDSMIVTIDLSKVDLSHQYVLPVTIAQSSLPIEQWSHLLLNVAVKNQYDGNYHSNGVFHHPVNGDRAIDEDKKLETAGPSSVLASLGDLGGSGYQMILTVNADNTVTITPAGATPNVDQHWGPNFYDPETKSFHLNYSYNTAAPRIVEEVITLK